MGADPPPGLEVIIEFVTVVLGVVTAVRWTGGTTPAFVAADIHRNLSLLGLCLLAAHIVTTVLDPFAHITVRDVKTGQQKMYSNALGQVPSLTADTRAFPCSN